MSQPKDARNEGRAVTSPRIRRLYAALPTIECQGLCGESCGPIGMSDDERRTILDRGVDIPTPQAAVLAIESGKSDGICPALKDGRCSVYEDRPLLCRMWGVVESMPCTFGCKPSPGLLLDSGAHELLARSLDIGGLPDSA